LRNEQYINAQESKKFTDGDDEKKSGSGRALRIKGRSKKAKIHIEKTKSTTSSKPLLNTEDGKLFLMKLMMKMILKWKKLQMLIYNK
jgi:hypothetical protein